MDVRFDSVAPPTLGVADKISAPSNQVLMEPTAPLDSISSTSRSLPDLGSAVAMAFPASLTPSEASTIVEDAVAKSMQAHGGKVDLAEVQRDVNNEFQLRGAGNMKLSLSPNPTKADPSRTELRSSDSLIRVYESGTHGGRTDTSVRVQVSGKTSDGSQRVITNDRMRFDNRLQAVMRSPKSLGSPELPYVPSGLIRGPEAGEI